jgi:hypothetical protein
VLLDHSAETNVEVGLKHGVASSIYLSLERLEFGNWKDSVIF